MIDPRFEPSPAAAPAQPLGGRGLFWFFCLVCIVVLFANLGGAALFEPDEGRNAEKAREILLLDDWVTPYQNFLPTLDKPMAYYWLVALSLGAFGVTEWAARLPSVLAGAGCIFLVYRFARAYWHPWDALWSALVLLTSVAFFVFSRIVIFDMTLSFFITLALTAFYFASEKDEPRSARLYFLAMYAAVGIGTLIKGPIAAVIPGMVIFCYVLLTRGWRLLRKMQIAWGLAIYLAVVLPWYLAAEAANPGYLEYFLWQEHWVRYLTPQFSRTGGWYYFIAVLVVGGLPWSLLMPLAARNVWRERSDKGVLFLVLWLVLPVLFFSASHSKLPHYILPVFPALALLTGRAIAASLRDDAPRRRWVLYLPWAVVLGFGIYLMLGAAVPDLLARPIRAAALQSRPALILYVVVMCLVFAVWLIGNRRDRWRDERASYFCTAVGLALFFVLVGQIMAASSDERSSKSLALSAAPLIRAGDRIVFYNTYMEAAPFYLMIDRPIWLVQVRQTSSIMGSNYLGARRPAPAAGYGPVLFTPAEFAQQWAESDAPLKVFVRRKLFGHLVGAVKRAPRIVARWDDYLLVTNR